MRSLFEHARAQCLVLLVLVCAAAPAVADDAHAVDGLGGAQGQLARIVAIVLGQFDTPLELCRDDSPCRPGSHPDDGLAGWAGAASTGGFAAWASDSYSDRRNRWYESAMRGVACDRRYPRPGRP